MTHKLWTASHPAGSTGPKDLHKVKDRGERECRLGCCGSAPFRMAEVSRHETSLVPSSDS